MRSPVGGKSAVPELRPHPFLETPAPPASAVHLGRSRERGPGVRREPIVRPFPDVADDVVESESSRGEALHLARPAHVLPAGSAVGRFAAPRILEVLIATARCEFPLDL